MLFRPRTTWRRTMTSEHWQEKRRQTKNNMEEDNNIRALAREKEADQEQLSSSMLFLICLLFSCHCPDVIVLLHVVLGLPPFLTKNNMEEDNNIRALAREKEADQEQHGGGQ
jgi:hypothetical protein